MTTLDAVLRAAYVGRQITARIAESGGETTVGADSCRLAFSAVSPLAIRVEGGISRESFYALALADEVTEGTISAALERAGRFRDAQQVKYSLDAIRAGRGPIYERQAR